MNTITVTPNKINKGWWDFRVNGTLVTQMRGSKREREIELRKLKEKYNA